MFLVQIIQETTLEDLNLKINEGAEEFIFNQTSSNLLFILLYNIN